MQVEKKPTEKVAGENIPPENPVTTELFLLRHGEPTLKNALLGLTNPELSALGWQQVAKSAEWFSDIDLVVSSPLKRCAISSAQYAEDNGIEHLIEVDFQEFDFGDWDGQLYADLHAQFPDDMHQFFLDPANNTPPNGESLAHFSQRIEAALLRLLSLHAGKRIVLCIHSGVIRTLLAWCLKMDYLNGHQFQRIGIDYGSISHISVFAHEGQDFPQLRFSNRTPDLK